MDASSEILKLESEINAAVRRGDDGLVDASCLEFELAELVQQLRGDAAALPRYRSAAQRVAACDHAGAGEVAVAALNTAAVIAFEAGQRELATELASGAVERFLTDEANAADSQVANAAKLLALLMRDDGDPGSAVSTLADVLDRLQERGLPHTSVERAGILKLLADLLDSEGERANAKRVDLYSEAIEILSDRGDPSRDYLLAQALMQKADLLWSTDQTASRALRLRLLSEFETSSDADVAKCVAWAREAERAARPVSRRRWWRS